jgi:hypothetical protein
MEVPFQGCTKSRSPFLLDVDLVAWQHPQFRCTEFPDCSGVRTLTPLTDHSGVSADSEFQKASERCCCASRRVRASGVVQLVMGWLAEAESNPTRVKRFFVGASGVGTSQ